MAFIDDYIRRIFLQDTTNVDLPFTVLGSVDTCFKYDLQLLNLNKLLISRPFNAKLSL